MSLIKNATAWLMPQQLKTMIWRLSSKSELALPHDETSDEELEDDDAFDNVDVTAEIDEEDDDDDEEDDDDEYEYEYEEDDDDDEDYENTIDVSSNHNRIRPYRKQTIKFHHSFCHPYFQSRGRTVRHTNYGIILIDTEKSRDSVLSSTPPDQRAVWTNGPTVHRNSNMIRMRRHQIGLFPFIAACVVCGDTEEFTKRDEFDGIICTRCNDTQFRDHHWQLAVQEERARIRSMTDIAASDKTVSFFSVVAGDRKTFEVMRECGFISCTSDDYLQYAASMETMILGSVSLLTHLGWKCPIVVVYHDVVVDEILPFFWHHRINMNSYNSVLGGLALYIYFYHR